MIAAFALAFAAGCGSTRPVEAPEPYDDSGIVITVKPRVYIDWPFGFETIRGTAENRTGHDVVLHLYLNLVDSTGAVVGYAADFKDLKKGEKWKFEALTRPGSPGRFHLLPFARPPPYTRVERGFVCDPTTLVGAVAYAVLLTAPAEAREK